MWLSILKSAQLSAVIEQPLGSRVRVQYCGISRQDWIPSQDRVQGWADNDGSHVDDEEHAEGGVVDEHGRGVVVAVQGGP